MERTVRIFLCGDGEDDDADYADEEDVSCLCGPEME
jgi:hypothetical protein